MLKNKYTFVDHREQILKTSQDLVKNIKELLAGTTSSKDGLIEAAQNSVTTTAKLCEQVKAGAASLSSENPQAQVFNFMIKKAIVILVCSRLCC